MRIIGLAVLILSSSVLAESGHPITFKCDKLPPECVRQSPCGIRTFYRPRSQGTNMARYVAGWKEYLPGCDDRAWGNLSLAVEYSRSRNGERIAQYLFGSTQLHFSGSEVQDRCCNDLLADYFGLPTTFKGSIAFEPRIDNVILAINYYLGLDQWCDGLYFKFNMPIVVTRWDLGIHCNEVNNISPQERPVFPSCYMSSQKDKKDQIEPNQAETALSIREALSGNFVFGDMQQPFMFGAFACGREQKTAVAQLDFILGYNIVANERGHFGLYIITVVPTGNSPENKIIFEPIVGNTRLWELGVGTSFHYDLVRWGCHKVGFLVNGILTHQFKHNQIRSFDLIGHGPMSRYMLLKEFTLDENKNLEYSGRMVNAIDFATRKVRVGGSVKLDLAAKLTYYYSRFGLDLGYNIYARTKEKLKLRPDLFPSDLNNKSLGIKGTEGVCYSIVNTQTGKVTATERLNSTQNRATICSGATVVNGTAVDNPKAITVGPDEEARTWNNEKAFESDPPILITIDSLDIISGSSPHQLTHKFFAHMSYTAGDVPWEPQIGIGGEIEVDGRERLLAGLDQWGFWVKFACSF